MSINDFDSSGDPRIHLAVARAERQFAEEMAKEKLKCAEEMSQQKLQSSEELAREKLKFSEESGKLRTDLELIKQKLSLVEKKNAKRSIRSKVLAILASLLFLGVSIAASIGVNQLTAAPPNPSGGWLLIALAAIVHVATTLATTFLDFGGE